MKMEHDAKIENPTDDQMLLDLTVKINSQKNNILYLFEFFCSE